MKILLKHDVGISKATDCSKKILDTLKEKHKDKISNMVQNWTGNKSDFSFKVMNFNIKGTLVVNEKDIVISAKLPLGASLFKGMIEKTIKEHSDEMIKKCKEE